MGQYRKKPVVVEAWQWTPPELIDMPQWLLDAIEDSTCCCHQHGEAADMVVTINTLEGMMTAQPGDWIIKGVKGEIYPCKPEIFAATYDPAELERLPDAEAALQPCGYCEKHVARPCHSKPMSQMCDERPDTSDIPETNEDWFAKAKLAGEMPPGARADAMQTGGWPDPKWRDLGGDAVARPGSVDWRARPIGPGRTIPEDDYMHPNQRATRFRDEIEQVINSHSRENGSGTPDFVLAQFVLDMMDAFDRAVTRRQAWYGRPTDEKALIKMLNDRLLKAEAESTQLRGELQRVSMAGMTPSMVVGK